MDGWMDGISFFIFLFKKFFSDRGWLKEMDGWMDEWMDGWMDRISFFMFHFQKFFSDRG